ncbi:hypothetical protein AOQ84DRAFT_221276, partial [Glonium stellatum]
MPPLAGVTTLCLPTRDSGLSPASSDSGQPWRLYGARSSYSRDAQAEPLIAAILTAAEAMVDQPETSGTRSRRDKTTRESGTSMDSTNQNLHWVTSNNLDGFRTPEVMKEIRQAAMHDHLRRRSPKSSNPLDKKRQRLRSVDSDHSVDQEPSLFTSNKWALQAAGAGRNSRRHSPQSDSTQSTSHVVEDDDDDAPLATSMVVQRLNSPQWQMQMQNITPVPKSVYAMQTQLVAPPRPGPLPFDLHKVGALQPFGTPLDPFRTMPQVAHPQVSVEKLKFHCSRVFGTKAMGLSWVPALIKTRHAFLSTLCIASTHRDATKYRPTESYETLALRQEVIHLIQQSILNPHTCTDDSTIIALVQLICSEMINGEEKMLEYHEGGMETMVKLRGGLEKLGVGGELASILTSISHQSAIFRETQPRAIYQTYCKTLPHMPVTASQKIPESPLFCPRADFATITGSPNCRPHTRALLAQIRDMTDLFLDTSTSHSNSSSNNSKSGSDHTPADKAASLAHLHRQILALPSSTDPNAPPHLRNDWTYEACRIAAVIQAIAMQNRVPLSTAAALAATTTPSSTSTSTSTSASAPASSAAPPPTPHSPLHALAHALALSNLSACWADMAGVLFWAALIGGAAARAAGD